ncbi:MAG: deoxyribose-phosphate aldolase [Liquorilactobacillus nagelii]|uniref:deoxyribose-phosphate aldolase n=1 Tax=Liquorilactobacillus nagelii TaxID=82688 RepID=UPI0039EC35FE
MNINSYIDHTLLKPEATEAQIELAIRQAIEKHFYSVMVNPYWVAKVAQALKETDVKTATVIGFPLGANTTSIKVAEAKQAIIDGADEIDMVMNIGELKAKNYEPVINDIASVTQMAHHSNKIIKVIIETCLLTDDEIVKASTLVAQVGADFVKTSTGFSTSGATVKAVALMSSAVKGTTTQVKAAGGIHSFENAKALIDAGATRLGVSHSLDIINNK